MKKNYDIADVFCVFAVSLCLFALTFGPLMELRGEDNIRKEAIRNDVAEYIVNPKTGVSKFTWKLPKVIIERKELDF